MADTNTTSTDPNAAPTGNGSANSIIGNAVGSAAQQQLAQTQLGAASRDQNAALSTLQSIQDTIAQMLPPQLIQYAQPLAQLAYTGQYNVQDITAAVQQASALNGIQLDPAAMAAQTTALNQYQAIAEGSGFTPIERAGIAQTMNQIQTQNTGANASIVQQNQQQGQGGVVNSLAARLISQQGANQNASLAGAQIAASGQQRAIGAIGGEQSTGQSIAGQEVGQQNIEGQAQNAINQYNAGLKQQTSQANQSAENTAASQQQQLNVGLEQQNVQNQLNSQQQQIGASQQTYADTLGKNQLLNTNATSQAGVDTQFGLPEQQAGLKAQTASTQQGASATASGLADLYKGLTSGGSGSDSATTPTATAGSTPLGESTGGKIHGPGTPTSDSIPARLSTGEFVVKASAVDKYEPVVKAINEEKSPQEIMSILDRIAPPKKKMRSVYEELGAA